MSNLPSENEIKGETLDSNPRLNPLLSKYDNLRTVSLELHHRKTLEYENLQKESPVKEIADGICLGLLKVTSDSRDSMEDIGGDVSNKQGDHIRKDSEIYQLVDKQKTVGQDYITEILHDDVIQGLQENKHDLHQDIQDLKKLQEKFIDLHEDLQSEEVRDDLRELHEVLLKDVRDDLLDLHEDILDLQDLQNAGIKIVLVEPVQTSDPLNQDLTPEDDSTPESNQHSEQDSTPEDLTPESNEEQSLPKVTVPILVSFKDKYSDMFEEGPERKVSFRDTTGVGELHQVLYYSGSEESFIPETSPIITLSGGFDNLSDIEIDLPNSEDTQTLSGVTMTTISDGNHGNNTTLSGVNSTDTMLQIEKDFVNVRGGTSADIMMELEKHFLDIGDRMNFMLESGPKHNALPRRIRQDSLTEVREYGISGSVELLDRVQEESSPDQEESSPDQEESSPVQEESSPDQEESSPVQEESLPVQKESSPVQEESLPIQKESSPVQEESLPVQEDLLQEEDDQVKSEERSISEETLLPIMEDKACFDEQTCVNVVAESDIRLSSSGNDESGTDFLKGDDNRTTDSEGCHKNETNVSGISDMEEREDEGALLPRNYVSFCLNNKHRCINMRINNYLSTIL